MIEKIDDMMKKEKVFGIAGDLIALAIGLIIGATIKSFFF